MDADRDDDRDADRDADGGGDGKMAMNVQRTVHLATRSAIAAAVIAGVTLAYMYRDQFSAAGIEGWISGFGAWAPLVFIAGFALAAALALPALFFTIAGGALFGPFLGTFYSVTGATIGATIAFLVARYVAAGWVSRHLGGRTEKVVRGVDNEGWRFVAFVRLVPLIPFNVLNYALGLTRIPTGHYVLTSFVCMIPGGGAYTYLGYAGREALAGSEDMIRNGLIALGLLAAVAFLPRFVRKLRGTPAADQEPG